MDSPKVKYPIGQQDFKALIEGGFLYVDKTKFVYDLTHANQFYFLSRPRRFGKSLLLSTLRYYFEGEKELFKGLAIEKKEQEWSKHPVLLLSLASFNPEEKDSLRNLLAYNLQLWEEKYSISPLPELDLPLRFSRVLRHASQACGKGAVVLIDEYDAPLISTLSAGRPHEGARNLLKSFYSIIKDNAEFIRFSMLTGVSRFSHMSIFSGLNNLDDISLSDDYCDICGITPDEINRYFDAGLDELSANLGLSIEESLRSLKDYYDGYHFSKSCNDIYNPFSLLSSFKNKELGSYWMRTGTPGFLMRKLVEDRVDINDVFNSYASEESLAESDLSQTSLSSLLFQTGYLTIKSYNRARRRYRLGIPNKEVEEGLFENLMKVSQYEDTEKGRNIIYNIGEALKNGNPEKALEEMRRYLGGIGYPQGHADKEFAFQNNLLIPLKLLGMDVESEVRVATGRIDMVVKTDRYLYLFEFKMNRTAREAIEQINEKDYALPFVESNREVFKIGVNFSSSKRNIERWEIEKSSS